VADHPHVPLHLAVDLDAIGDDPDRDDAAGADRRVDPPEQAADRLDRPEGMWPGDKKGAGRGFGGSRRSNYDI
jgi:hypothetical protein